MNVKVVNDFEKKKKQTEIKYWKQKIKFTSLNIKREDFSVIGKLQTIPQ